MLHFPSKNERKTMLTIFRTLFYQFFILFIGLSVGFIFNPEWVGVKGFIVQRSISNIFFPIQYDANMDRLVKGWGAYGVFVKNNMPNDFEILDEHVFANEEFYWCRFKFRDINNKLQFAEDTHRVRWKSWEYYYDTEVISNSNEARRLLEIYDQDIKNRKEQIQKAKEREEELLQQEKNKENKT